MVFLAAEAVKWKDGETRARRSSAALLNPVFYQKPCPPSDSSLPPHAPSAHAGPKTNRVLALALVRLPGAAVRIGARTEPLPGGRHGPRPDRAARAAKGDSPAAGADSRLPGPARQCARAQAA